MISYGTVSDYEVLIEMSRTLCSTKMQGQHYRKKPLCHPTFADHGPDLVLSTYLYVTKSIDPNNG